MGADDLIAAARRHEIAGALAGAEADYRLALDRVRGSASRAERQTLISLARLCANDGREFEALALAVHARALSAAAGDDWHLARALLQVANALDALEDYERIPAVLDQVRATLDRQPAEDVRTQRLSIALHEGRLAANLGDLGRARAALAHADEASRAATGAPIAPRITWFVNVVALNTAGRFAQAEPWLDRMPPAGGMPRRELEYAEQRAWCLLGLRPEPDGVEAATALLDGLDAAPAGTMGAAWRLRMAAGLGLRLARLPGAADLARRTWNLAGHAIVRRLRQIEDCMRALPEVAAAGTEVHDLLTGYRTRFYERHEQVLRAVAAARPWPPVDELGIVDAGSGLAVACAWCTRVRSAGGEWTPIRQFLPDEDAHFTLSHGICASCWERSAGDLAAYQAPPPRG